MRSTITPGPAGERHVVIEADWLRVDLTIHNGVAEPCQVIDRRGQLLGVISSAEILTPAPGTKAGPVPVRAAPRPAGLGDWLARLIQAATMGRLRRCGGCEGRRRRLNRIGRRFATWRKRATLPRRQAFINKI